ncbi:hypothetical protein VULLAG_LOCUS9313 [Vulpes lagopus]
MGLPQKDQREHPRPCLESRESGACVLPSHFTGRCPSCSKNRNSHCLPHGEEGGEPGKPPHGIASSMHRQKQCHLPERKSAIKTPAGLPIQSFSHLDPKRAAPAPPSAKPTTTETLPPRSQASGELEDFITPLVEEAKFHSKYNDTFGV